MTDDLYKSSDNHFGDKFYIVSPKKFIVLFVGTLGLYSIYWFYQQWDFYRSRTDGKQWPIIRSLFPIFFAHSLFSIIALEFDNKSEKTKKNCELLATIFVVSSIVDYILSDLHMLVTFPVIGWILYRMQLLVNVICDDANGESNNTLTVANYFWILLMLVSTIWLYLSV